MPSANHQQVQVQHQPGDAEWNEALDAFFWKILARRPDAEDRNALIDLWNLVRADQGEQEAWVALISALLRHPESVQY